MKTEHSLPKNYQLYAEIDLLKNKKLAILLNISSLVVAVLMIISAMHFVGLGALLNVEAAWQLLVKLFALLALSLAYIALHEAVHGLAMKLCGTKRVKYGYSVVYAYAGSEDYYPKGKYIFIALAPVILWGIVLALAALLVPRSWFWVVYFVQITNISGAVGDAYVTVKMLKMPKNILVQDTGTAMSIFAEKQ